MFFDPRAAKALQPGQHLVVVGCPGLRLVASGPLGCLRLSGSGPWIMLLMSHNGYRAAVFLVAWALPRWA